MLLLRHGHGARTSPVRGSPPSTFDEELATRLARAIQGDAAPLYQLLANTGGLPGVRVNARTVEAFARACGATGAGADRLVMRMVTLDALEAPGASEREILPVCAVAALGARAAGDPERVAEVLAAIHDRADDLRFRVREAVPDALARIGAASGEALVGRLDGWMDGFFHAAAVVVALAKPLWLDTLKEGEAAIARFDEAWTLAVEAPRSSARYPGYKALLEALSYAPGVLAARFRAPMFEAMVRWAGTSETPLQETLLANLNGSKMTGRLTDDVERVRRTLKASATPPRDPTEKVQGMRGRGARRR